MLTVICINTPFATADEPITSDSLSTSDDNDEDFKTYYNQPEEVDTDSSRTENADSESEEESQKEGDKSSSPTVSTDGSGSSSDDDSSSTEPELDPSMCLLSCLGMPVPQ